MNKKFIALFLGMLLTTIAVNGAETLTLPPGSQVFNHDNSGKTWQVNAVVKLPLEQVQKYFLQEVAKHKMQLKHQIKLDDIQGPCRLLYWTRGRENLLMMLWQDAHKTYFSWGFSNR